MFLTREIPEWEKFPLENSEAREGVSSSLSETMMDLAVSLDADPDLSVSDIVDGGKEKSSMKKMLMKMEQGKLRVPKLTMTLSRISQFY